MLWEGILTCEIVVQAVALGRARTKELNSQ